MSPPWEDYGLTVADVQASTSGGLHPTILLAFCHGIYTCIFFIALYYIIESMQPNQKRITLAGIIAFLWFSNTVILALEWNYADQLLIVHGTSLEAEFNFSVSPDLRQILAIDILRFLNILIADLILIWRCWVLYGRNLLVITVSSLCVVTEIISGCMLLVSAFSPGRLSASQVNWTLVHYLMTVATNSLCTFLILFRIVRVSGIGASLKTYRGMIEILIESAAMYAIIYIVLVLVYAYQFYTGALVLTAFPYPQVISFSITGIAPTLIIARVMAGQSRPDDSWTRPTLPHLRSDVLSATESLQFASAPNQSGMQTTTTDTGHASANIDLEAQVIEAQHAQDGGEDRAEAAGVLVSGDKQDVGKVRDDGLVEEERGRGVRTGAVLVSMFS